MVDSIYALTSLVELSASVLIAAKVLAE